MGDAFYDFARLPNLGFDNPLNITFGDELRLLGFDTVDDPRRQETHVQLYWQAMRPIERDLRIYPFFVDQTGQVIEDAAGLFAPRRWW